MKIGKYDNFPHNILTYNYKKMIMKRRQTWFIILSSLCRGIHEIRYLVACYNRYNIFSIQQVSENCKVRWYMVLGLNLIVRYHSALQFSCVSLHSWLITRLTTHSNTQKRCIAILSRLKYLFPYLSSNMKHLS